MRELLLLFAAAVLHECGHLLAAALLNIPFSRLTVRPCGAVMTFDFSGTTYLRELCVHLAGGLCGMTAALLAWNVFGDAAVTFCGMSVCLTGMNLLPIEGFDGGGILRCLCMMLFSPEHADTVCRAVSFAAVLFLWTVVLWVEIRVRAALTLLLFVLYILIFSRKL